MGKEPSELSEGFYGIVISSFVVECVELTSVVFTKGGVSYPKCGVNWPRLSKLNGGDSFTVA